MTDWQDLFDDGKYYNAYKYHNVSYLNNDRRSLSILKTRRIPKALRVLGQNVVENVGVQAIERHALPQDWAIDDWRGGTSLRQTVAAVALAAYNAGRHATVAGGEEFKKHAMVGLKSARSSAKGAEVRKGQTAPHTRKVLDVMGGLIDDGQSIRSAAAIAWKKGHGSSAAANNKLWHRHHRKK